MYLFTITSQHNRVNTIYPHTITIHLLIDSFKVCYQRQSLFFLHEFISIVTSICNPAIKIKIYFMYEHIKIKWIFNI